MMSRWSTHLHCGALTGLAVLLCAPADADEALRKQVHKAHRHESYMLVENADGAWLYLFETETVHGPVHLPDVSPDSAFLGNAIAKTRSTDARTRVRGLTELAGADTPEALDTALSLLTDPDAAVRDEAAHLILDHPDAGDLVAALGLIDEDESDD